MSYNAFEAYKLYEDKTSGVFGSFLTVSILCPVIMLIQWFILMPLILKSFTICTNVNPIPLTLLD